MKALFIDTNIAIDLLAKRMPFFTVSQQFFSKCYKKGYKLYISADSISTLYYIINKQYTHTSSIAFIIDFLKIVTVIELNGTIIKAALSSKFTDFEDALQYHSAISNTTIECIVTRNAKDFKLSSLPVYSPQEALDLIT